MKLILACVFLLLKLLVHGYRPESILNVAHVLSEDPNDLPGTNDPDPKGSTEEKEPQAEEKEPQAVDKEEKPEGPHGTKVKGKELKEGEEQTKTDCLARRKSVRNWYVKFASLDDIRKRIEDTVHVQSEQKDTEDKWGGLIKLDGNLIQLYMGVQVAFEETKECAHLETKDLRFANSLDCEQSGENVEGEAESKDGKKLFTFIASNATLVLKREEANNDTPVVGDWTFDTGDFTVSKTSDGKLKLQQKMWSKNVSFVGNVTQPETGGDYVIEMKPVNSECKKFKVGKCPDLCKDNKDKSACEADDSKGHKVILKLKKEKINELTRTVDDNKQYAVKRSYIPVDAEVDAFVCVNVNSSWVPIRGMSFKQIVSNAQKVQDAEDSKGMKVFESKSFGKKAWLQEEHFMIDGLAKPDGHPTWKRSIEATVEWKKAQICPKAFPVCYTDGDCVSEDCKNGCDWSKSPTVDSNDDLEYNWIAGSDAHGTPCDVDNEALEKTKDSAPGLSFVAFLVAVSYHIL